MFSYIYILLSSLLKFLVFVSEKVIDFSVIFHPTYQLNYAIKTGVSFGLRSPLIGNIFINLQDLIYISGNFTESVTDDLPNFLVIEIINSKMIVKEKMVKRDFSKFDKEKLIKDCNILKMNNEIENI